MKLLRIPKNPKTYLDVIKLLAILLVVFNHSGNTGYKMYLDVEAGPARMMMLTFSALVKIAVPLFFMASGALLLGREEPWKKVFFGRAAKFAAILAAATFFFYADGLEPGQPIRLGEYFIHLYRGDLTGHLWFLYSYLCFLIMLPFLRKLAGTMQLRDFLLLLMAYQTAQLLPVLDYALFGGSGAHTSYFSFFMAADYVVYPLLGCCIDRLDMEKEREETFYLLLFLGLLCIFFTSLLMEWRCSVDGGWTSANREAYMGRLSVLPAMTVFYGAKKLCVRIPSQGRLGKVLSVLAGCTFGVYLLDPKWREFTRGVRWVLTPVIGAYAATLVQTLCACVLGLAGTFLFKCLYAAGAQLMKRINEADDPPELDKKEPAA